MKTMKAMIGPAVTQRLVAERAGVDLPTVMKVVSAFESVMQDLLEEGCRVRFLEGGHLTMIETKATRRTNPHTKGVVDVPAGKKIVFKVPKKR